jgi:hypothetical protein
MKQKERPLKEIEKVWPLISNPDYCEESDKDEVEPPDEDVVNWQRGER